MVQLFRTSASEIAGTRAVIRSSLTDTPAARRLQMQGLVQGQGVRPAVARLAFELGLGGDVRNTPLGVEIRVIGVQKQVDCFERALHDRFQAHVLRLPLENLNFNPKTFRILASQESGPLETELPIDLAICSDCLDEVRLPSSRRYRYPFNSCTRCGPRYSIIHRMPFDRARTSMGAFPMCQDCQGEYRDPRDRRFHAQTSSCPQCGPTCWSTDNRGQQTGIGLQAIEEIAHAVRHGRIAAIKGCGGFQLVCDATSRQAVRRLRTRKCRPTKPFPIMVDCISTARLLASISELESEVISSAINPIVLVRSRFDASLSDSLHPGLSEIGVMLPTTPLHWLIIERIGRPIVVTSANAYGSPIAFRYESAFSELSDIADVWLDHDREIVHPIDDSVVRCIAGKPVTIRAARGIAPLTIRSSHRTELLAVGGHQKVALAIHTGKSFVLAPHIADMDSVASRRRFDHQANDIPAIYGSAPQRTVCDQHPGYFSTEWATTNAKDVISVQHHHAHVAAAMLDHGLEQERVLGFAFDGTGYGSDGTVWGGEVLLASARTFQRVAHLRPFALPGGEMAIKQPWRTAMALLQQSCDPESFEQSFSRLDVDLDIHTMRISIGRGSPTTSVGRLFDAVAALILPPFASHYEGEPAMMLEAVCDTKEESSYHFEIESEGPFIWDWRSCIQQILQDRKLLSAGRIAMKFHRAVANAVIDIATHFRAYPAILSGGVFQNRVLVELIASQALAHYLRLHLPDRVPVNDGGLAIGQLVVALNQHHLPDHTTNHKSSH